MAENLNDEETFCAHILTLKKLNPSWTHGKIADHLKNSEFPPSLKRDSLRRKISRILARGTTKRKPGSGCKSTVRTDEFAKQIKKLIHLKKGTSQRKVHAKLQSKNIKCSRTSVRRTIKEIKLKPFKRRKSQKFTEENKIKRVACAKNLREKYGVNPRRKWKWDKIVNTDFSGIFTFEAFQNSKNDVIYAKNTAEIPASLRNAPKDKYPKGVMFWGGICSLGLIPKSGPINFTKYLQDQRQGQRGRMYMTGELYARFLREKAIPAIRTVVGDLDDVIFQDDQDKKHRARVAMDTVNEFFIQRVDSSDGDAKFADCWLIENVWGILREKVRGKTFKDAAALTRCVNKEWKQITPEQCAAMMKKMPGRLLKVIEAQGEQIFDH